MRSESSTLRASSSCSDLSGGAVRDGLALSQGAGHDDERM